ncbi:MAG TPA: putative quinol monooxygenase [Syntrophomonadaceae bacterium]|nr:putative quinol monooxygenase [Syntrophomonadaceae bacterium]
MIVLIAAFKAKTGKEMELEQTLKGMIPEVQNEAGTIMYILNRSAADNGQFVFYEMYQDKAALEFHSTTPYFQELLKNIDGLVVEDPQIDFYEDIASIRR